MEQVVNQLQANLRQIIIRLNNPEHIVAFDRQYLAGYADALEYAIQQIQAKR